MDGNLDRIFKARRLILNVSLTLWLAELTRKATNFVEVPEVVQFHGLNVLDGLYFHGIVSSFAWGVLSLAYGRKDAGNLVPSLVGFAVLMAVGAVVETYQSIEREASFDTRDMFAYGSGGLLSSALTARVHSKKH